MRGRALRSWIEARELPANGAATGFETMAIERLLRRALMRTERRLWRFTRDFGVVALQAPTDRATVRSAAALAVTLASTGAAATATAIASDVAAATASRPGRQ